MTDNPRKRAVYAGDWSKSAGRPYRPSNGTEGEIFESMWCDHCERDRAFREDMTKADGCPILADVQIMEVGDPEYPKQWRRDENGVPECSGFVEAATAEGPE